MRKVLFVLLLMVVNIFSVNALSQTAYYDLMTKNITQSQVTNGTYDREQTSILKKELDSVMGCKLPTTGAYDSNTVKCVKAFQRSYGFSQTGYINNSTRKQLNSVYKMNSVIVKSNVANIRNGAGTSGTTVIGTYTKGQIIRYISRKYVDNHYWYKFYYNGTYAYISDVNLAYTFIEIDIVSQTMRFYKERALFVDTPVVTGRTYGNYATLRGFFYATDKAPKPTSYAQYGINIGGESGQFIHDYVSKRGRYASYSTYGGSIYSTLYDSNGNFIPNGDPRVGSLGCVNTPLQRLTPIYNNVKPQHIYPTSATPIYVH